MELTILIVVLFLGVGIPLRNKRYKKWNKKREDKNGEGFKGMITSIKQRAIVSESLDLLRIESEMFKIFHG